MTTQEMIIFRTNEIIAMSGIDNLTGSTCARKLMELAKRFRQLENDKAVDMCELLSAFAAKHRV